MKKSTPPGWILYFRSRWCCSNSQSRYESIESYLQEINLNQKKLFLYDYWQSLFKPVVGDEHEQERVDFFVQPLEINVITDAVSLIKSLIPGREGEVYIIPEFKEFVARANKGE